MYCYYWFDLHAVIPLLDAPIKRLPLGVHRRQLGHKIRLGFCSVYCLVEDARATLGNNFAPSDRGKNVAGASTTAPPP